MRSEILPRIQELLAQEDLEGIRVHVREAIEQFRALTAEEVRKQREAWASASNDPDAVFEYQPAPEEEAFEAADKNKDGSFTFQTLLLAQPPLIA